MEHIKATKTNCRFDDSIQLLLYCPAKRGFFMRKIYAIFKIGGFPSSANLRQIIMPTRKSLLNNEIYHVITRGVADMPIFKNDQDRYRAIFSIYEFNNDQPVEIRKRREERKNKVKIGGGRESAISQKKKTDELVDVLAFCLMPNHIHLLLRQNKDGGISKFMRKFGSGYANYFNIKYKRKGYLFQGRFKSIRIKNDVQLRIIFSYIHTNPVSLIEHDWKEKGINNLAKIIPFLSNFKWSSYSDYLGKDNFPSVTKREFLLNFMGGRQRAEKFVLDWLRYKKFLKGGFPSSAN